MRVGDYVKTKDGYIFKIEELLEKGKYNDSEDKIVQRFRIDGLYQKNEDYMETDYMYSDWIIKSSPNIIDLIEVGDYVNGCKIIELATNIEGKVLYLETDITEFDNVYACGNIDIYEKDIRTIVTKEQFKEMEYKL